MKKIDELCEIIKEEPEKSTNHALESHDLRIVDGNLKILKEMLATVSRTAKLWIQHLYYVQVVKLFIRAERTGNWNLHLIAISKMINLFAASGHIHYAKSARIHLQICWDSPSKYAGPRYKIPMGLFLFYK